jgi:NADH-quinone oxidoreductase subunit N
MLNFEYELIILFSIIGLVLINVCEDFLSLYLAVELQSLCFYILSAFNKKSEYSAEAGLKYFIMGAFFSGFLLLALALFYISFGCIALESIKRIDCFTFSLLACYGCLFFSSVLLFKLGAFPFHM